MRLAALIYLTSISLSQSLIGSGVAQERSKETTITQLIEQLEHHDFAQRNEATSELWSLGVRALPQLEQARLSGLPETSKRASMVSRLIRVHMTPTSSSELLSQVRLYIGSSEKQQKQQALEEILKLGGFEQAMALIKTEEDHSLRRYFADLKSIQRAIFREANKAVHDGDIALAIQTLRLAPYTKVNARALSHLLKSTGQLREAIKEFQHEPESEDSINLYLTMLRAEGDVESIKDYATQHGRSEVLDSIAVLEGDPMPAIGYIGRRLHKDYQRSFLSCLTEIYEQRSLASTPKLLESLVDEIDFTQQDQQDLGLSGYVMHYAMLLGERELGEELLVKMDKDTAIEYFSRAEKVSEALKLIAAPDLVKEPKLFAEWLDTQIKIETEPDSIFLDNNVSKVVQLANFYISRGQGELAVEEVLKPLLSVLAVENRPRWREVVVNLFHRGMGEQATQLVLNLGGEDGAYSSFTVTLFENSEEVAKVWSAVAAVYPDAALDQQFLHLMSLMGVTHADTASTAEVGKAILNSPEDVLSQQQKLEVLLFAAESRGDLVSMLEFAKQLCQIDDVVDQNHLIKYWQAALAQANWKELLGAYEIDEEFLNRAPINLVYCAIAKRKLGLAAEGQQLLDKVILHAMGSSEYLNRIAYTLQIFGYNEEALQLWRSSMIQCDGDESGFLSALKYTNNYYRKTIDHDAWDLVSAYTLVELASDIHSDYYAFNPVASLHSGFEFSFALGMSELQKGSAETGVELLGSAHHALLSDGSLADRFFPTLLRFPQLERQRRHWFSQSWNSLAAVLEIYPQSHNTHNTVAWLGARTQMKLKESKKHAHLALEQEPHSPAYLDTLAEIHFSERNRRSAIKHSDQALRALLTGAQPYVHSLDLRTSLCWELLRQNQRFRENTLPQLVR